MRRLGLTEAVWMASSNDLPCSRKERMNSFWNDVVLGWKWSFFNLDPRAHGILKSIFNEGQTPSIITL
jgi:hypothetical protein